LVYCTFILLDTIDTFTLLGPPYSLWKHNHFSERTSLCYWSDLL